MSTVIEHLNMTFQDYQALRDVNLEIRQGEFIAILGPSGCGKTTLLRLLAGFLKPTGGTITMDGVKIADSQEILEPNKRNIGMVFQSYALWPHMTVLQQVLAPGGTVLAYWLPLLAIPIGFALLACKNPLVQAQTMRFTGARLVLSVACLVISLLFFSGVDTFIYANF